MISLLLILALQSTPLDRAVAHLEAERFEQAIRELEQADRADPRYRKTRDGAVKGVARDLQRAEGYAAAAHYLESRLESRAIVDHYTEVCIWGGEEQRGLERIGRLSGPAREFSRFAQVQLHWAQLDFESMARVAREAGWNDWAEYAEREFALRRRLDERATRGWWVTLAAALAMATACLVLRWLAPTRQASARPDAQDSAPLEARSS